jgi:hypothetical protein
MSQLRRLDLPTKQPERSLRLMSLNQILRKEPKELAQFASDAYHVGISDTLLMIRMTFPDLNDDALIDIRERLMNEAFRAVEWRRNVEWVEGIDHSISPSKTYVSIPIERYEQLKALEVDK